MLCWSAGVQAGPYHMLQRVLFKVGLSSEQMEKVKDFHFAAERKMIEIRYQQDQTQLELEQALGAKEPDRAKIFALIEKVEVLEVAKHKNRLGFMLDIRALMSPEQWRKLETLHKERGVRRGEPGR